MKVYGHPLSSCTRKVLIALGEKAHPATLVTIDLFAGEHRQAAHLARHPLGKIPVIDDDGFVLFESRAILRYLDARLPGVRLTPTDPHAVARMDQWLSIDQAYVSPEVATLVRQLVLAPASGQATDAAAVAAAHAALDQALAAVDAALQASPYLAGDTFSLADVSLMPPLAALPRLGGADLVAARAGVTAWWERVSARPSWRAIEAAAAPH